MDMYLDSEKMEFEYADDEELIFDEKVETIKLENIVTVVMKAKDILISDIIKKPVRIPMLVTVYLKDIDAKPKLPMDLVCIWDRSGSMQGRKNETYDCFSSGFCKYSY